jgi:adenylylsulfate kinase
MYNGHKKYALFIGRWQPFHNGHKYLIDEALSKGENVCVAIRDTEISDSNPYSAQQRVEMLRRVYGERLEVIVIPDISSINVGRNVGYDVNFVEPPSDVGLISGTNVRSGKDSNVPPEIAEYIKLLRTTLWLTGLPCSGKTTIAKRLKEELDNRAFKAVLLDADDIRNKLNVDLGFSPEDRKENLRRVAHVAKLFNDNGNFVIASFVSPNDEYRKMVKEITGNFKLVFVKCSPEVCQKRDVKGMYKKAKAGEIKNFTGVSAPFEEPLDADIVIDTERSTVEECVREVLDKIGIQKAAKVSHCLLGRV